MKYVDDLKNSEKWLWEKEITNYNISRSESNNFTMRQYYDKHKFGADERASEISKWRLFFQTKLNIFINL